MIKKELLFVGFKGFYHKRFFIRDEYNKLSDNDKRIYKYYIYSRIYLKENVCNIIWEFLNDDNTPWSVTEEVLLIQYNKCRM